MVEQLPFKQLVPGSNPGRPTTVPFPTLFMKRLVAIEDRTARGDMLVEILCWEATYPLVAERHRT